jgi:hypothetical protein
MRRLSSGLLTRAGHMLIKEKLETGSFNLLSEEREAWRQALAMRCYETGASPGQSLGAVPEHRRPGQRTYL